jgi:hypothetical protein
LAARHVAPHREVQERQPAREIGSLDRHAAAPVGGERALLQLDGAFVLALEVQGLAEAIERLGALARLLEAGTCALPVAGRERFATAPQEVV